MASHSLVASEATRAAAKIQELFLAGRRDEAAAAVPDEFLDDGGLFGSEARIRERYAAWESSGATTLVVRSGSTRALEIVGTKDAPTPQFVVRTCRQLGQDLC